MDTPRAQVTISYGSRSNYQVLLYCHHVPTHHSQSTLKNPLTIGYTDDKDQQKARNGPKV